MAAKKESTKELAKREFTLDTLAEIGNWEEAIGFLQSEGVEVFSVQDVEEYLGDGFTYVEKNVLVNVPLVILRVDRRMSPNFDVPFSTIYVMSSTNKRMKFTDFSTGVDQQLSNMLTKGKSPVGMILDRGLLPSEYDVCDECKRSVSRCECETPGKKTKATTYFLAL